MPATIDIRTKPLLPSFLGQLGAFHSYIIFTKEDGTKYILRAGPEGQNALIGDVYVVGAEELVLYQQSTDPIHHDWDEHNTHLIHPQLSGTDAEMGALFEQMRQRGREINAGHYDYETVQQNCNTVMGSVMQSVRVTPIFFEINGKSVALIGHDVSFTHGPIDNSIEYLQDKYVDIYKGWIEYFEKVDKATSWGDPHLVTSDGLKYDFQQRGEYVLLDSPGDGYQLQVRQEKWDKNPKVSVNTALATELNGTKVMIKPVGNVQGNAPTPTPTPIPTPTPSSSSTTGVFDTPVPTPTPTPTPSSSVTTGAFDTPVLTPTPTPTPTPVPTPTPTNSGAYNFSGFDLQMGTPNNDYFSTPAGLFTLYQGLGDQGSATLSPVTGDIVKIHARDVNFAAHSFGYYTFNASGSPVSGKVIWANNNKVPAGTSFSFDPGTNKDNIGYFMIPNGGYAANQLLGITDGAEVTFNKIGTEWSAFLNGSALNSGASLCRVFFSNTALNPGNIQHQFTYKDTQSWDSRPHCTFDHMNVFSMATEWVPSVTAGDTFYSTGFGVRAFKYNIGTDGVDSITNLSDLDRIFFTNGTEDNLTVFPVTGFDYGTFIRTSVDGNGKAQGVHIKDKWPHEVAPHIFFDTSATPTPPLKRAIENTDNCTSALYQKTTVDCFL